MQVFVVDFIPKSNLTQIIFANSGASLNEVYYPYGLFIPTESDILYIADTFNQRILKWLPNATRGILVAGGQGQGSNSTQLNCPYVVFADRSENVYVADTGNNRVQYFINGTSVGRTIAGNGAPGFANNSLQNILGLAVDLENNIYVSIFHNASVMKCSPNATSGVRIAGTGLPGNATNQLNYPAALYVDPITSILYIPNQGSHCVTKWLVGSSSGLVVAGTCGIPGSTQTLLTSPTCVTFDKYGNMYIVDWVNGGRVIMFYPNSLIGIAIVTVGLYNPTSIAIDTHMNLYVADYGNSRIVKYMLL
jgi:hypothetical protein